MILYYITAQARTHIHTHIHVINATATVPVSSVHKTLQSTAVGQVHALHPGA